MKILLKITVLYLLTLLLLLSGCNKEESSLEETLQEVQLEKHQGFISFDELSQNIGESNSFLNNKDYFDRNIETIIEGRGAEFVNAYVDTNSIHLIETETINYYTLKLINNNPDEKANIFYNLVFEQILISGEVTSSILQYNPDLGWLFDKTQKFKGDVKKFTNDLITLEDLNNGLQFNRISNAPCISSITIYWVCTVNNHSGPGVPGGCGGAWHYNINTEPCGNDGGDTGGGDTDGGNTGDGDTGDNDNSSNDESTGGGGSQESETQTVVLELCNDFLPDGEEDSEDCVDDYSEYFVPYICGNDEDTTYIHNWVEANQDDAAVLATYLASVFTIPNSNYCASLDFNDVVDIFSFSEGDDSPEASLATLMTLAALSHNYINGPYDSYYYVTINDFTEVDLNENDLYWTMYFTTQCAIIKSQNPEWSDHRVYWEASKEMIHIGLDVLGLVPVIGEICDVANGVIYTIEGDGVNATLSYAGAIPFAGWFATGAKFAYKGTLKFTVKAASGLIDFGNRSKLAKVIGTVGVPNTHAHHLIPWARRSNALVQKAAKSGDAFHMNEALNGIARPSNLHLTGHNIYNTKINQILVQFNDLNPNLSNDEAFNFIEGLTNHVRDIIVSNPTLNSGQIANLITFPN